MKPILGWTMLSRDAMRQAERLASGEQDTRDEVGFLLIIKGFADSFSRARQCFTRVSDMRFSCLGCSWMRVPRRDDEKAAFFEALALRVRP